MKTEAIETAKKVWIGLDSSAIKRFEQLDKNVQEWLLGGGLDTKRIGEIKSGILFQEWNGKYGFINNEDVEKLQNDFFKDLKHFEVNSVFMHSYEDKVISYLLREQLFRGEATVYGHWHEGGISHGSLDFGNKKGNQKALTDFFEDICKIKIGKEEDNATFYSTGYKDKSKGRIFRIKEALKLRNEIDAPAPHGDSKSRFPNVKVRIWEALIGNFGSGMPEKETDISDKNFMVFTSPVLEENQYRSLSTFASGGVIYGEHLNSFEQLVNKYK